MRFGKRAALQKYVYLMLNKPQGYISATEDKHYKVVTELVRRSTAILMYFL